MANIETVADLILSSSKIVVFTGAGISTESGISDFRSPGGIWSKYDPNEFTYQRFLASEEAREKYWQFSVSFWPQLSRAEPNPGHYAIAQLYSMGKLDCVITQNIDGLHQKAGLPDEAVIELHGTAWWVLCLDCGSRYPREAIQRRVEGGDKVPRCSCGGIMKPATISFGQAMPVRETAEAEARAAACNLFIVAGSSLVVYPAAQMPLIAKSNGARLVIINLAATPHDPQADAIIRSKTGEALSAIAERVSDKLRGASQTA